MADVRVQQLLDILARAYDRKSWHGTNLRGSLRGVDHVLAAHRPGSGRHNVWELAVHCAYWKYAVWRRLAGEKRGSFALKGSNWFERPSVGADDAAAWVRDLSLLRRMHLDLLAAVAALSDRDLSGAARGSTVSRFELIAGVAAHDVYHAGQIQLVKALVTGASPATRA